MFEAKELVRYLDSLNDTYGVPGGEIRITKGYEEIFHYTFGDRLQKENEGKDYYWFYSMSKVYTMTCILQLVEQGVLSLETKLTEVFPSLVKINPAIEKTTLRHLMTMTGGLDYTIDGKALSELRKTDPRCMDPEKYVEAIYRDAMIAEPGEMFNYSLCHDICGAILWKLTGLPLDQYMKKYIFEPLGIKDLTFFPDEDQKSRYVPQYSRENGIYERLSDGNQLMINDCFASGGAGLSGNLVAYMTMPQCLANGGKSEAGYQVLKSETIDQFRAEQLEGFGLLGQFPEKMTNHGLEHYSYGLGVRTKIIKDEETPVGEFGWDGAAGGYILIDPENHLTVGYLQHIMHFGEVYGEIHPTIRRLIYEQINKEDGE